MITQSDPANPERTIIEGVGTVEMVNARDVSIGDVILHQLDPIKVTAVKPLASRIRITADYVKRSWTVAFNERRDAMIIRVVA